MSAALVERPWRLRERIRRGAPARTHRRDEGFGSGRLTLERRLERVWERLADAGETECPLCRSRMTRPAGAAAEPAHCGDCGSVLS